MNTDENIFRLYIRSILLRTCQASRDQHNVLVRLIGLSDNSQQLLMPLAKDRVRNRVTFILNS